jgi:DNA-binding NarL/FixJ family response regulator
MSIRILIADDQGLLRAGFRMILESEPDLEVVAEAEDGAQAVELTHRHHPDVVLMDIRMPVMDGLTATRRILDGGPHPPRIVMLTTFDLDEYVFDALQAGASGFVLKDLSPEELVAGVRAVAAGESLLAPVVTRRVIESFVQNHPQPVAMPPEFADLTPREREIFALLGRGLSNTEIAERLVVSNTTVKTHVARVLFKLGLRDRVQAVVLAYESGVVRPGEPL